jgi:hypothetical protein
MKINKVGKMSKFRQLFPSVSEKVVYIGFQRRKIRFKSLNSKEIENKSQKEAA